MFSNPVLMDIIKNLFSADLLFFKQHLITFSQLTWVLSGNVRTAKKKIRDKIKDSFHNRNINQWHSKKNFIGTKCVLFSWKWDAPVKEKLSHFDNLYCHNKLFHDTTLYNMLSLFFGELITIYCPYYEPLCNVILWTMGNKLVHVK